MKKKFTSPKVKVVSMSTAQVIAQSAPVVTFDLDGPAIDQMYSKGNKGVFNHFGFGTDEEE